MTLDIQTLTAAGAIVAFFAGVLLAGAWVGIARSPALLWWSAASFVDASGIALLAAGDAVDNPAVAIAGITLFSLSPALIWGGVRVFNGERVPPLFLLGGTILWLAIAMAPIDGTGHSIGGFLSPILYLGAASYELWRENADRLSARWGLIAFFLLHALMFFGGILDALTGRLAGPGLPGFDTWFGLINFESLLYSMGTALFMVVMAKERSERRIVAESRTDSLTGVANRGALLDGGARLLQRCQQDGVSFSLIIFDIDHFKRVNDTYGHAAGDNVLRAFTDTALAIVRPGDLFGRYGGEEFLVILPRATVEAAYVIADRIRIGFGNNAVSQIGIHCTASAGVAEANSAAATLEYVIKAADACLYRAKEMGRNRVERPQQPATGGESTIARIA